MIEKQSKKIHKKARLLWMRELSILKEVENICGDKLKTRYDPADPWKVLDDYDERRTEERYRF